LFAKPTPERASIHTRTHTEHTFPGAANDKKLDVFHPSYTLPVSR
jgi:hypothetical protein